jgi:molybdate transport system ATP-binding protein
MSAPQLRNGPAGAAANPPAAALSVEIALSLPQFSLECSFQAGREAVVLFGPSGSGKTSVLDSIAGFRRPRQGRIALGERVLFCSRTGVNLPVRERRIGYLSQQTALFPHLTVRQNVAYGLLDLAAAEREARVAAILERFRIAPLADCRPAAISGGEQQRVALARTLVCEPELLLLDEPLTGLDLPLKTLLLDTLFEWQRERAVPMLYVTHEQSEAFSLARRVLALEKGRVVADGAPYEVFDAPIRRQQAVLAGYENILKAVVEEEHLALGTMTCRITGTNLLLESPLGHRAPGESAWLAVRAGDILVATAPPSGISARNVLGGRIQRIEERAGMAELHVEWGSGERTGVSFCVHITRGSLASLGLRPGAAIWLVIKTHSIQFLRDQE